MIRVTGISICALLIASAAWGQGPGQFLTDVLREDLAVRTDAGHRLTAEPEQRRIVSPPALRMRLREYGVLPETVALSVTAVASAPAEIELQLVYNEETPFRADRRALAGTGGEETVHWTVYKSEQLTGLRFALRSHDEEAGATLTNVDFVPIEDLAPRDHLHAFTGEPLRPLYVLGGNGGEVEFELVVPEVLSLALQPRELRARFVHPDGTEAEEPLALSFDIEGLDRLFSRTRFSHSVGEEAEGTLEATVVLRDEDGGWQILAETSVDLSRPGGPAYELPGRSIEDFAVAASGEELILYAGAGDEGLSRVDAPLPIESVWIVAGNGERWVLEEPMLRTRRDTEWLAGGVTGFSVGRAGPYRYGVFTAIGADGTEALSLASARGSWRLSPSARNPYWRPPNGHGNGEAEGEEAAPPMIPPPTWRGNAFFSRDEAMFVSGLEQRAGEPARVRVLTSPIFARWVDLGVMPLPGLPADTTWLTGYMVPGGYYYLLAGPELRLYRSEDPLRNWEPVPVEFPAGMEKAQLLQWDGRLWLFMLDRQAGRGIVRWMPVEEMEEGGFRAVTEFEFNPPALRDEVGPPPPPLGVETLVR